MKIGTLFERVEKLRNLRCVSLGPRRLRQQVVADVDATGAEQRKRVLQVGELAGPGVGENEVELSSGEAGEKCCAIGDVKTDS